METFVRCLLPCEQRPFDLPRYPTYLGRSKGLCSQGRCLLTTRLFFLIMQRLINLLFLLLCIHLCILKKICKFFILYSKKFDTEPCWHPKPPSNSLSFFIFIFKLPRDIRKAFSLHALWL